MSTNNDLERKSGALSTQSIQRIILIVLAALIASVALFGGYYYWDRYVHQGDKSPLELDIELMEQVIRDDPQDPEARVALAEFYLDKGLYKDALEQTSQVLDLYPEHEGAMLIAGITHARWGKPENALEPLEKFAALRQEQPTAGMDTALEAAYYFLGESYVTLERADDAIRVLEAALVINATDADALYQVGLAYQSSGQPEIALERYHKAVRLVPDFVEAYSGMIVSYDSQGQSDYVAYARGMEAFCLQDYGTAKTHLEFATGALPDFAPAFLGLGLTYERLDDLEMALVAVQRALDLNPDDYAARQALGRIQAAMNSQG